MAKVSMFVSNNVIHDSRVQKEALSLSICGHDVTIFGLGDASGVTPQMNTEPYRVEHLFLSSRKLPKIAPFLLIKLLEFYWRAYKKCEKGRHQVFHAHDLPMLPLAWLAARKSKGKLVYDSHELYFDRPTIDFAKGWRWLQKRLMKKADLILAANEERAEIMWKEYSAPTKPVVVHNYPLGREIYVGKGKLLEFLRKQGKSFTFICIHQGKISLDRCPDILIRALPQTSEMVGVFFLGGVSQEVKKELNNLSKQLGVEHRVAFHPRVPHHEVMSYTAEAQVGISLYRNTCRNNYLCAPNKNYDYALARIPIIASDFPSMRRELEGQEAGLLVDPEDPAGIAEALNHLVKHPDLRERMGNNAQRAALDLWNWEQEAVVLCSSYEKLLRDVRG